VRCVAPSPASVTDTVLLRGRIAVPPGGDLGVASQVPGRLVDVAVHEGQKLATGDVIATVDDSPARTALQEAEAALAQARATEANAQGTLERTRTLVSNGIGSQQQLEDATAREAAATAGVTAAKATLDMARRTFGRVQVRASFPGVVTRVWRGGGAIVDGTAATPIVQIAQSGGLELQADATQRDLLRIETGQVVHGQVEQTTFDGTVLLRGVAVDAATGLATVRVTIVSQSGTLPLGAFGTITIDVAKRDGVPTLPTTAIRGAFADGPRVAVCGHGVAEMRPVKVGYRDADRFELLEGLAPGERVAIDHVLGLDDGTKIEPAP
jgi:RND family efflux transporter MFP subunit